MPHSVKRGDLKVLKWNLGRDLSGITTFRVIIKAPGAAAAVIDRNGTLDTGTIVKLPLIADDWTDPVKLEVTGTEELPYYNVEIETLPGPLTHPDVLAQPYERLYVTQDQG